MDGQTDRRTDRQSNGRTHPPKEMQGASKNLMLDFLLQACVDFNIVVANVPGEIRSPPWYCSIILSKTYVLIYCDVYFDYFGRICISVLSRVVQTCPELLRIIQSCEKKTGTDGRTQPHIEMRGRT